VSILEEIYGIVAHKYENTKTATTKGNTMTAAQLERNRNAGKACFMKYGKEHMAALGRKGGGRPKAIVYQAPTINIKGVKPRSYTEMLKVLFSMPNLKEGGLKSW